MIPTARMEKTMTERDTRNSQTDWNESDRKDRNAHRNAPGQPQQWHDESYGGGQAGSGDRIRNRDFGSGQQGGSSGSYSGDGYADASSKRLRQDEQARSRRESQFGSDSRGEQRTYGGGGSTGYYDDQSSRFGSFTSEDQGGRDFSGGSVGQGYYTGRTSGYSGRDNGGSHRGSSFGDVTRGANSDYHPRGYAVAGRDYIPDSAYNDWRSFGESRGFLSRAGDEVASWFGDQDAARRREQDHRENHSGRGPADYTRSDERIREDANDALTHDRYVNASNVTVKVEKGEVTLDGSVDSREAKRRAEDAVDRLSGVTHVQNNLRVNDDRSGASTVRGTTGSSWNAGSATSGTSAATGTAAASNANKAS